jgi:hypothetical protein
MLSRHVRLLAGALCCSIPFFSAAAFAQADYGLPGDRPIGPAPTPPDVVTPAPDTTTVPPDTTAPAKPIEPAPRVVVEDESLRDKRNLEPTELLYIIPTAGTEYVATARIEGTSAANSTTTFNTPGTSGWGVDYGGRIGFMFGNFRVGAMYNRGQIFSTPGLHYDMAYLELGVGGRRGVVGVSAMASGGYNFMGSDTQRILHGAGGRLALAVDIYIGRHFSIGPELAGTAAAYFIDRDTRIAAYGFTLGPRFGIHI